MPNEYGLDYKYFQGKLKLVVRDADRYTPMEMYRELSRLAKTAKVEKQTTHDFILELLEDTLDQVKNSDDCCVRTEHQYNMWERNKNFRIAELEEIISDFKGGL